MHQRQAPDASVPESSGPMLALHTTTGAGVASPLDASSLSKPASPVDLAQEVTQRPPLQHAAVDMLGQLQAGLIMAPDPRGVIDTCWRYWAAALLLIAPPPHRHSGWQ